MKDRKTQNTVDRITEEELRASLDNLRHDMELFSGHYYKDFEEAYKHLFGDGLEEQEAEVTKVGLSFNGKTLEVNPNEDMAIFYLETILQNRKSDINVKVGKLTFTIPKQSDEPSSKKSKSDDDDFEEVDLDDYDDSGNAKAKILAVIPVGKTRIVTIKVYEVTEVKEVNGKKKTEKFFICLGKPDGTVLYRNKERADEAGDAVWLKIKSEKDQTFTPGKARKTIYKATSEKYADCE